tara:strand:+ start:164194 stop:164400 length:207 start_codon:yes stop_codon:yes gene_type:complete
MKASQKRPFRKTTDSNHGGPVAANLLDQGFAYDGRTGNGASTSVMSERPRAEAICWSVARPWRLPDQV